MASTTEDTLTLTEHEVFAIPFYEDPEDGDPRFAHIVNPPANQHIWHNGMSMQEVVDIARFSGLEVTALCGYTWIPKRNPEKYDVCPICMKMAGDLMRDAGE